MVQLESRIVEKGIQTKDQGDFLEFSFGFGVNSKDFGKLNSAVKPEVDLDIPLGRGRIYPRHARNGNGTFEHTYTYGNELKGKERGLAPFEIEKMLKMGFFTGFKGVFFLGLKGELYLLDILDQRINKIVPDKTRPDSAMPSKSEAQHFAFPTATAPNYRRI